MPFPQIYTSMHMQEHTHTRAHAHTCTHTHTHAHTHTHMNTHSHTPDSGVLTPTQRAVTCFATQDRRGLTGTGDVSPAEVSPE